MNKISELLFMFLNMEAKIRKRFFLKKIINTMQYFPIPCIYYIKSKRRMIKPIYH